MVVGADEWTDIDGGSEAKEVRERESVKSETEASWGASVREGVRAHRDPEEPTAVLLDGVEDLQVLDDEADA